MILKNYSYLCNGIEAKPMVKNKKDKCSSVLRCKSRSEQLLVFGFNAGDRGVLTQFSEGDYIGLEQKQSMVRSLER
jgi:hypothetical protein